MNYHRGPRWQQGAGIGSLFSGIFRGLTPVAKSAMKTIEKVAKNNTVKSAGKTFAKHASKAAVETALDALEGKPVGKRAKQRLKTATRDILLNAANQSDSKNQKIPPSKKRKKPSPNYTAKRRRVKRQPLFDDRH